MNVTTKGASTEIVGDLSNGTPTGEPAQAVPTQKVEQGDSDADDKDSDDDQDGEEEEEEEEAESDDSLQWHGGMPRAPMLPKVKGNPNGPKPAEKDKKGDKTKNVGPRSKTEPKPAKPVKDRK